MLTIAVICFDVETVDETNKYIGLATINQFIFNLFRIKSVFAALEQYFAGTDNFTIKFDLVNRNYLDHGMTSKYLGKKQCVKLFLLYDNLLDISKLISI